MAQTKEDVNILLLGEGGSGKSTFINSLANYLKYETLQEAMNSKPECLISTSFTMADENYEDQVVSIDHHSSSLCSPGDIFGDICEYKYHMEEATIRVIETPAVLQEINGERIVSVLSNYSHLNAIVFLLKSNGNIASEYLKLSIRHLLTIVDKTALGNIIFVLTHSRSTSYKPGETMTHLKTLIKCMGVDIPCDKSNIFCVDNESFGYLVASHQGMNVTSNEMKTFSKSWKRSRENCLDLLEYVASMKEKTIGKRQTDKYTPQMLDELGPLLCNLSMALGLNLQILDGYRKSKVASKIELFTIVKAAADNREATICKSLKCRTIKVNNSSYVSDKQICHKPCCCTSKLEANNILECEVFPRNGCIKCYCPPRFHKRVKSLRVLKDSSPSSNSNCEEDLVKAISVVEYEYDLVTDALALLHLHAGMSKNYIFETLEFEKNRDYMSNMPVYSCLNKMFEQKVINLQKTNTNSLQSTIDSLYKSKSIRQVLIQIFGAIEETRSPMKKENCAPVRETASNDEFTFDKLTSSFDNLLLNVQTKCESPRQLEMLEKWHRVFAERTEQLKARLDEAKAHMTRNQVDEPDCSNLDNTRSTGSHSGVSETSILPKKEKNLLHLSRRKIRAIRAKKQKDLPYMSNEQNDEKPLVLNIL